MFLSCCDAGDSIFPFCFYGVRIQTALAGLSKVHLSVTCLKSIIFKVFVSSG